MLPCPALPLSHLNDALALAGVRRQLGDAVLVLVAARVVAVHAAEQGRGSERRGSGRRVGWLLMQVGVWPEQLPQPCKHRRMGWQMRWLMQAQAAMGGPLARPHMRKAPPVAHVSLFP